MFVYKGFLPEQLCFEGFFYDETHVGNARANSWARAQLGESGYQIIFRRLGREPDTYETFTYAKDYGNVGYDPEKFQELLEERDNEETISYELPEQITIKHGYTPGSVFIIPRFWRVIVGPGEGDAGVIYCGDDPFEAQRMRRDYLEMK
ncbi:MAG: hypothetical protein HYW24_05175 [Candidatus Aenigmarchaeota archaeon]|nr:hypothetical protein [Candidatus Aenigmarchaeota archaeon]